MWNNFDIKKLFTCTKIHNTNYFNNIEYIFDNYFDKINNFNFEKNKIIDNIVCFNKVNLCKIIINKCPKNKKYECIKNILNICCELGNISLFEDVFTEFIKYKKYNDLIDFMKVCVDYSNHIRSSDDELLCKFQIFKIIGKEFKSTDNKMILNNKINLINKISDKYIFYYSCVNNNINVSKYIYKNKDIFSLYNGIDEEINDLFYEVYIEGYVDMCKWLLEIYKCIEVKDEYLYSIEEEPTWKLEDIIEWHIKKYGCKDPIEYLSFLFDYYEIYLVSKLINKYPYLKSEKTLDDLAFGYFNSEFNNCNRNNYYIASLSPNYDFYVNEKTKYWRVNDKYYINRNKVEKDQWINIVKNIWYNQLLSIK